MGGVWDVLRIPYVERIMVHLGYFTVMLGVWKLLAVVAVLAPRLPRLKERAYAGMIFSLTGAIASHIVVDDGVRPLVNPIVVTGAAIASCALRPPTRRDFRRPESPT